MRYALLTFLFAFLLGVPSANSNTALVTDDGYIAMTGYIDYVSIDTFTIITDNDDHIEVSMDEINDETLDQLLDSDVLTEGKYVTVRGELEDGISGPVIKAETINVHANERIVDDEL